jgi:hypothetical protein
METRHLEVDWDSARELSEDRRNNGGEIKHTFMEGVATGLLFVVLGSFAFIAGMALSTGLGF